MTSDVFDLVTTFIANVNEEKADFIQCCIKMTCTQFCDSFVTAEDDVKYIETSPEHAFFVVH